MKSEYYFERIKQVFSDTLGKNNPQGVIIVHYTGLEICGRLGQSAPIVIRSDEEVRVSMAVPISVDKKFLHLTPYGFDPQMLAYQAKKMILLENIVKFARRELNTDILVNCPQGFEADKWHCYSQRRKRKNLETLSEFG